MKVNKTLFIVLICTSAVVIAGAAVMIFYLDLQYAYLAPKDTFATVGSVLMLIGLTVFIWSIINFVLKRRLIKRYNVVKDALKNVGDGIYVQGTCGTHDSYNKAAAGNTLSFGIALTFMATFGKGVFVTTNPEHRVECYIIGNEMYAGEFTLKNWGYTGGYNYMPAEDMKTVYAGWFARHTVKVQKKRITITAADGQTYFKFDLTTCSATKEQLLKALENVFGGFNNLIKTERKATPSPFGDL